jgi:hypothetical protein
LDQYDLGIALALVLYSQLSRFHLS